MLSAAAWEAVLAAIATAQPSGNVLQPLQLTEEQEAVFRALDPMETFQLVAALHDHQRAELLSSLELLGDVEPPPDQVWPTQQGIAERFPLSPEGAADLLAALRSEGWGAVLQATGTSVHAGRPWAMRVARYGERGTVSLVSRLTTKAHAEVRPSPVAQPAASPEGVTLADRLERLGQQFPPTLDGLRLLRAYGGGEHGWQQLAAHLGIDPAEIERHHEALLAAVAMAA